VRVGGGIGVVVGVGGGVGVGVDVGGGVDVGVGEGGGAGVATFRGVATVGNGESVSVGISLVAGDGLQANRIKETVPQVMIEQSMRYGLAIRCQMRVSKKFMKALAGINLVYWSCMIVPQ